MLDKFYTSQDRIDLNNGKLFEILPKIESAEQEGETGEECVVRLFRQVAGDNNTNYSAELLFTQNGYNENMKYVENCMSNPYSVTDALCLIHERSGDIIEFVPLYTKPAGDNPQLGYIVTHEGVDDIPYILNDRSISGFSLYTQNGQEVDIRELITHLDQEYPWRYDIPRVDDGDIGLWRVFHPREFEV